MTSPLWQHTVTDDQPDSRDDDGWGRVAVMPFAVGLLAVVPDAGIGERMQGRLEVALLAHSMGYFLVDVVEVRPGDDDAYDRAVALAVRTDADAFVARGGIDGRRLEPVADRIRMRIRYSGS